MRYWGSCYGLRAGEPAWNLPSCLCAAGGVDSSRVQLGFGITYAVMGEWLCLDAQAGFGAEGGARVISFECRAPRHGLTDNCIYACRNVPLKASISVVLGMAGAVVAFLHIASSDLAFRSGCFVPFGPRQLGHRRLAPWQAVAHLRQVVGKCTAKQGKLRFVGAVVP
ncbi:hypothetical protein, conserved in T.vivax [Trypanosoma vivax Y486]|uniref:Uncharacterized protein n=1 Tax=Trypanosoma vivax (strain Y486) TaxID=1055687 RepID=F9WNI7_TRYVY|nr:hypothetical protein, conserved in T.vivax [Trypanosoma vivax Y486]|eukprot:CCD19105.1 hypothetical protein, conserved in T.vivax [Trypanosoma vivax Y486]